MYPVEAVGFLLSRVVLKKVELFHPVALEAGNPNRDQKRESAFETGCLFQKEEQPLNDPQR